MAVFEIEAIGHVRGGRRITEDDNWDQNQAVIELDPGRFSAESLRGLDQFSHAEIIFVFDQVRPDKVTNDARHPRGRLDWPKVGIFAQRGKNRPSRIGISVCRILSVSGLSLAVGGLDAVDGSPVLDIKPVMSGFLPRGPIVEPGWAVEIMKDYWTA
jgi:tRNA-Thr(GGU) m(6)t(6)A37 methyltransferase TsaA